MASRKRPRVRGDEPRPPLRAPAVTRARAAEIDVLVLEVARLMLDGKWTPEAALELSVREGVAPSSVEEWATQAGRMLRISADLETQRAINVRRLDETYATGDGKVRVAAVAEQNKMLGLHVVHPVKVDVTVQAFAELDDASMLERVERQLAELTALRASLLSKMGVIEVPALPLRDRTRTRASSASGSTC